MKNSLSLALLTLLAVGCRTGQVTSAARPGTPGEDASCPDTTVEMTLAGPATAVIQFAADKSATGCGIKANGVTPVVTVAEGSDVHWQISNDCPGALKVRLVDKPQYDEVGKCGAWTTVDKATDGIPGTGTIICKIRNIRKDEGEPETRCAKYRIDWKYAKKLDSLDPILDVRETQP